MIATLAEVKSILGITNTSLDVRIQALMPIVQNRIIEYCKNTFAMNDIVYTSDSIYFVNTDSKIKDDAGLFITDGLLKNAADVCITYSLHNNRNFTVNTETTVTETVITVDEEIVEEPNDDDYAVTVRRVEYPYGLKDIFSNMINTKILMDEISGGLVKSKKLETFSVTFATENMAAGYLKSDWEALSTYRKIS